MKFLSLFSSDAVQAPDAKLLFKIFRSFGKLGESYLYLNGSLCGYSEAIIQENGGGIGKAKLHSACVCLGCEGNAEAALRTRNLSFDIRLFKLKALKGGKERRAAEAKACRIGEYILDKLIVFTRGELLCEIAGKNLLARGLFNLDFLGLFVYDISLGVDYSVLKTYDSGGRLVVIGKEGYLSALDSCVYCYGGKEFLCVILDCLPACVGVNCRLGDKIFRAEV